MTVATVAYHADWSVDARKRWMTRAKFHAQGWILSAPTPVGDLSDWAARLRADSAGGAVALGVDLPLGLPRAYAQNFTQASDFPSFLRGLDRQSPFFDVCAELSDLSPARPFYPARGRAGMRRLAHAEALGLADATALSRLCDRATAERPAGAPLFWTLGANQTGKAAITAWRDWLIPALHADPALRLWPFDGDFLGLLTKGALVVAETYPAEALRHLGLRMGGSKRRQADRAALAAPLLAVLHDFGAEADAGLIDSITTGFGSDAAGEDRFDSVIGVLGVLGVLLRRRPAFVPEDPAIRRWEGWVLGQTALPLATQDDGGSTPSP